MKYNIILFFILLFEGHYSPTTVKILYIFCIKICFNKLKWNVKYIMQRVRWMMNYKEILIHISLKYIINYIGFILFCMLNLIIIRQTKLEVIKKILNKWLFFTLVSKYDKCISVCDKVIWNMCLIFFIIVYVICLLPIFRFPNWEGEKGKFIRLP